jgi:hypothetical protein
MEISKIIIDKIKNIQERKPPQKFDWSNSLYEDMKFLTIDERGQLGEEITTEILKNYNCDVQYDASKTELTKGWDLIVDNLKIEVKLATITIGSGGFQHENLHSQRDFDGVLFIDIAPSEVYLTAVRKNDILWRKLHRRPNGDFKCDFTINHIQNNSIPKFQKYKTGLINSDQDFFNTYKWIKEN